MGQLAWSFVTPSDRRSGPEWEECTSSEYYSSEWTGRDRCLIYAIDFQFHNDDQRCIYITSESEYTKGEAVVLSASGVELENAGCVGFIDSRHLARAFKYRPIESNGEIEIASRSRQRDWDEYSEEILVNIMDVDDFWGGDQIIFKVSSPLALPE